MKYLTLLFSKALYACLEYVVLHNTTCLRYLDLIRCFVDAHQLSTIVSNPEVLLFNWRIVNINTQDWTKRSGAQALIFSNPKVLFVNWPLVDRQDRVKELNPVLYAPL